MPLATYPVPHLLGRIDYAPPTRLRPDGDTIHLFDPVLLVDGKRITPTNGKLSVQLTGHTKARVIPLSKGASPHATIRLAGLDAPEEHYRGTAPPKSGAKLKPGSEERSQPMWKPATDFLQKELAAAGWALVELDHDVVDQHGRVLGYVWASDKNAGKGTDLSRTLLEKGLAFPFVYPSQGDRIGPLLAAGAKARAAKRGVWKHYADAPLPFARTFAAPKTFTDPEPDAQQRAKLNLPVIFRRVVDAEQLTGVTLTKALRKYNVMDVQTGMVVTGDRYTDVPVDRRVWKPA